MQIDLDGKYADILELCLYNAVLTGMSQDGKAFTYVNQLASSDSDPSKRYEWFECACCPPNVTRTLGIIGSYLWSYKVDEDKSSTTVNIHLYSAASLQFVVGKSTVKVIQKTDWPWDGTVKFNVSVDGAPVDVTVNLRIPDWAPSHQVSQLASPYDRLTDFNHL